LRAAVVFFQGALYFSFILNDFILLLSLDLSLSFFVHAVWHRAMVSAYVALYYDFEYENFISMNYQ